MAEDSLAIVPVTLNPVAAIQRADDLARMTYTREQLVFAAQVALKSKSYGRLFEIVGYLITRFTPKYELKLEERGFLIEAFEEILSPKREGWRNLMLLELETMDEQQLKIVNRMKLEEFDLELIFPVRGTLIFLGEVIQSYMWPSILLIFLADDLKSITQALNIKTRALEGLARYKTTGNVLDPKSAELQNILSEKQMVWMKETNIHGDA